MVNYYHHTLLKTPSALAYLQGRGLNHPDLIDYFKLGYSDRTLGKTLPKNDRPLRDELKNYGMFRKDSKEHFVGCVTFPIFQADGKLGEIYGRRTSRPRHDLSPHLYLPRTHQGTFNVQSIGHDSWKASPALILCESIIDALSFWVHGFRHVTTSFGTNGFTDEMLECFKSKQIQSIWMAYDNDEAGNQAADALAVKLIANGFQIERILLPQGKDVNQVMGEAENPQQALQVLLDQRQSYRSSNAFTQSKTNNPWNGKELNLNLGDRHYRIRNLDKSRRTCSSRFFRTLVPLD